MLYILYLSYFPLFISFNWHILCAISNVIFNVIENSIHMLALKIEFIQFNGGKLENMIWHFINNVCVSNNYSPLRFWTGGLKCPYNLLKSIPRTDNGNTENINDTRHVYQINFVIFFLFVCYFCCSFVDIL